MTDACNTTSAGRWFTRFAVALLAITLLATATAGVVSAQVAVTNGTVFEAGDDGPTVEITENLTLDSPYTYPDGHTVDLSPNATFSSNGTTNVTVTTIDGPWTNLTTHNISTPLAVNATDKQNVTIEGETVTHVNISTIDDSDRESTELVYDATTQLNVTLTDLTASETIQLLAADGSVVTTVSTNENGTATATLPAGEKRLTVAVEPEPEPEPPDDDDGGGGGGGTEDEPAPTDPAIADVVEQLQSTTPSTTTQLAIDGSERAGEGVTVDPSGTTETVEQLTFEAGTSGTVDITEYTDPPTAVTQAIAETVIADISETTPDGAVDSDDPTDRQRDGEPAVTVVAVADISVASDGGGDADRPTATVTMSVPSDEITDPDDAVILHETPDGWERLATTVASTTGEQIRLAADTTFSLFAVAEVDDPVDDTSTATNETENETATTDARDDTGGTDDGIPGFGIPVALAALLSAAAIAARRG